MQHQTSTDRIMMYTPKLLGVFFYALFLNVCSDQIILFSQGDTSGDYRKTLLILCGGED